MKTLDELRAFAEGFRFGVADLGPVDDWIVWGGYDINIIGCAYAPDISDEDLKVVAYPAGWEGNLPDAIHVFIV